MDGQKILIVDDEPFNVDYLEQELTEHNFKSLCAYDGEQALAIVASDSPDLILLDIMMPVMDGFEVLKKLKGSPQTRNIPVVIISASSDLKSVVKGIQLGAEDYLPKPFEPTLLLARISSSLEKKYLRDLEQQYLKSMERELDIGREIQQGFLPTELPEVPGWEIAAYFKAAREVSGDFYDCFYLPDGNLLTVIGDVCDKGVGAALFMTLFRSLIRFTATSKLSPDEELSFSPTPEEKLRQIITYSNRYIIDTHGDASMFATIFISILNPYDFSFTYMNCGHEPVFWIRENQPITHLSSTGPLVGLLPEAKYTSKRIIIEPNDLILSFTDGVPDAQNENNEFFGKERLLELLKKGKFNSFELLQRIERKLNQFVGDAISFDDITMMAIRRK